MIMQGVSQVHGTDYFGGASEIMLFDTALDSVGNIQQAFASDSWPYQSDSRAPGSQHVLGGTFLKGSANYQE